MVFNLPKLDYSYDALEPHFDAQTMEIHHSKHHKTYTDNLNNLIKGTKYQDMSILEILKEIKGTRVIEKDIIKIRNNVGGYYNHNLFWQILNPNGKAGEEPSGELKKAIDETFESFESFKEKFSSAAAQRFGSGWAWLTKGEDKKLKIITTSNQDNPLMPIYNDIGEPILGLDVWEHAYYLKYQNRRPDYINAFWKVVNWQVVEDKFNS